MKKKILLTKYFPDETLHSFKTYFDFIVPKPSFVPMSRFDVLAIKGKIEGIAFNVPVPNGSCVDLTTELDRTPTIEQTNLAIKEFSENKLKGIVGYTSDPIVSSDVSGREETMVFDEKATMITKDALLKTLCWYDNGWGFSKRILEVVDAYAKLEETS